MSEQEASYEAVWPLGKSHWDKRDLNPGLGDLNGKTIAEVWDRVFRGEEIFPAIREALRKQYPGARFIEYDKRSEERRVGKERRCRRSPYQQRQKQCRHGRQEADRLGARRKTAPGHASSGRRDGT